MRVEVIYATESEQALVQVELAPGATLADAIAASGLCERYAISRLDGRIGVFGQLRAGHEALREGDRVEIYRPLLADPKDARRQRVRAARRAQRTVPPGPGV